MKHNKIEVQTQIEFQDLVDKKHFGISQAIVASILKNIKTRKKHINVLSVKCLEENKIIDITLEKNNFSETLKANLPYFEEREMFEKCLEISNAIKILNESAS